MRRVPALLMPTRAVASALVLAIVSACKGVPADGAPRNLHLLPGCVLRLVDAEVSFRAGLYTETWQFVGSTPGDDGYELAADCSCPFAISLPQEGLSGRGEFSRSPDGRTRARWRVVPEHDGRSNGLVVNAVFPGAVWRGGFVVADGRRVEFPRQAGSLRLLCGAYRRLEFSGPGSERGFVLEFNEPRSLLLQDDQAVSARYSTLTLRIFLAPDRYSGGRTYEADMWFSGRSVGAFETPRPLELKQDGEWVPIRSSPDVVAGSALDFSQAIPCRHRPAGRYGRVVAGGETFEFEKMPGVAQRFAGANLCGPSIAVGEEDARRAARRFSAVGYNSVRIHNHDWVFCRGETDGTSLNENAMRRFDALFAAFKDEGHYVTIDLFVNRHVPWRACGIDRKGVLTMADFKVWVQFHEGVFSNFLAHAGAFLNRVNTRTGIRYADDPALACVSLVNEANLGNSAKDAVMRCPEAASAYAEYTSSHPGRSDKALLESFYAERERMFARRVRAFLRDELKCPVLLANMNGWHYTDENDAVRKTEFDYADQHHYVAHPKYLSRKYSPPAELRWENPLKDYGGAFWLADRKLKGIPFACSEWNFCAPLAYRSQAGLAMGLLAASQSWGALWRYAWSDNPRVVTEPGSSPVNFFMIGADPLALATERATTCLFLRHEADGLSGEIARAREKGDLRIDTSGTSGGWASGGALDAGFLKAEFSGAAAIWVSALDGRPLEASGRLVVFHLTEVLNTGMRFADGTRSVLLKPGGCPLLARRGEARISLPLDGGPWRAYALASDGNRKQELPIEECGGRRLMRARTDCDPGDATLAYELVRGEKTTKVALR